MTLPKRNSATPSTACKAVGDSTLQKAQFGQNTKKTWGREGRTDDDDDDDEAGTFAVSDSCGILGSCSSSMGLARSKGAPRTRGQTRAKRTSHGAVPGQTAERRTGKGPGIAPGSGDTRGRPP